MSMHIFIIMSEELSDRQAGPYEPEPCTCRSAESGIPAHRSIPINRSSSSREVTGTAPNMPSREQVCPPPLFSGHGFLRNPLR